MIDFNSIYEIGDPRRGLLFQTSNANSNNSYNTDYGALYNQAWADAHDNAINNNTLVHGSYADRKADADEAKENHWLKSAAYAGTVFGLQWILEKQRIDDREEKFQDIRDDMLNAADGYCDCTETWLDYMDENKPETPEAALYEKVNCCEVFQNTIACNVQNHLDIEHLANLVNEDHWKDDIARMVYGDLKFEEKAEKINCQISDLLDGKIPVSDLMELADDSNEMVKYAGNLGCGRATKVQMLGNTVLRLQQLGRAEERENRASYNRDVSPISRQFDIRSMHKNPAQAMQWELLQAELIQQSLQNANNLAAVKDPTLFERVNARLAKCGTKLGAALAAATTQSIDVVNLNQFAQPLINSIGTGVSGLVGNGVSSVGNRNLQATTQTVSNTGTGYKSDFDNFPDGAAGAYYRDDGSISHYSY